MSMLLFLGQTASLLGNPTGGAVVAGSATIGTSGNTVTVKQNSGTAIINWQNFSIGAGELTKFVQPSSSSAALNRVISGNPSAIYGTLSSNGQIFLINPNGILVGAGGVINTAGFTASTRDIANADFLSGDLHFTGSSDAGVLNLGTINALGGNIYLIGHTVDNQGTINAPQGTAGLAAADDVTLTQAGTDNLFIQPNANASSSPADSKLTAVSNSGKITAATAELKVANGNMYALAINNRGSIVATTVKHQGGHILLMADSGTVENSGTLDASATVAGGQGGTVTLKSTAGTVIHTGKILAKGGQGGVGGNVDISGKAVQLGGTVDTTSPGGITGNLLIDPVTLDVIAGGSTSDITASEVDNGYISSLLGTNNLTLNADTNITVSSAISWSAATTLTLNTNIVGSTIDINAAISAPNGGLTINTAGSNDLISATGGVAVASFILQNGYWNQNTADLPNFVATQDFELQGNSTFLRVTGGNGTAVNPYQLIGPYDLEGIGSPSGLLLNSSFILENDVDATSTATWNGGDGFVPIGSNHNNNSIPAFTGTFNGNGHTINGLTIDTPSGTFVGLFGSVIGGTVENVGVTNVNITGDGNVAGLVGYNNDGTITHSYTTGTVTLTSGAYNNAAGGLVGDNEDGGTIDHDFSTAAVSTNNGFYVGGLVGVNNAVLENSYSKGAVQGGSSSNALGGLVGNNSNTGAISNSYSTGSVIGQSALAGLGGLAGDNSGSITTSFATGAVTANGSGTEFVGGLVGDNENTVTLSYATGSVMSGSGGEFTGGLIGFNGGAIGNVYATGSVSGGNFVGGLVGSNGNVAVSDAYSTGAVTGSANVGGLIGYNNIAGTITDSFWDTTTSGQSSSQGGVGATTAQLQSQAFVQANAPSWNFTSTWTTAADTTTPLLQALSVNLSGTTVGATDAVDLIELGTVLSSTTAGGGNYSFYVADDVLANGALLTDVTGSLSSTYYVAGINPSAPVTGVNLATHALNVLGTGLASNTALGNAVGTLTGDGINYTVASGALSSNTGVSITIGSSYALDGNIAAVNNAFNTTATGSLMGHTDVTLTGSGMVLAGSLSDAGVVTINSSGAIIASGAVAVGGFILQNGTWTEVVGSNGLGALPDFETDGDFELQNSSTFERFAGGNGSSTPYQITDVYGLQGLGSPSGLLLGTNAELTGDIDAGDTSSWNGNAGFAPIGTLSNFYTGTFNGQGHTISDLAIALPTGDGVGLFATVSSSGTVENVSLVNASVTAKSEGGLLVGVNEGSIQNSNVSGSIVAFGSGNEIGGLVGNNYSTISGSSSTASVASGSAVTSMGGLVGANNAGSITGSYATGAVNGSTSVNVGGLVGLNDASVSGSYATGAVTGSNSVGGLVGENEEGLVQMSYATGAVSGSVSVGGLVGYNAEGTVNTSYASGSVYGDQEMVGGLVGDNEFGGVVENSYATGAVTAGSGSLGVGGLVGTSNGTINLSYATGSVTGLGDEDSDFGGLVGFSSGGMVESSFATGAVTLGNFSNSVGGLVGQDVAQITTSYSTGTISVGNGGYSIGGLVGLEVGVLRNSYTTSTVTTGSGNMGVGGLAGFNEGSIFTSFWDTDTAGQTVGVSNQPGNMAYSVQGATTAQLESEAYIDGIYPGYFDFTSTWNSTDIYGNANTPQLIGLPNTPPPGANYLSGTAFADSGSTVDVFGVPIDLFFDGSMLGSTTTNATGGFTFTVTSADLTQGILLSDTSNHGGNTYFQANSPAGTIAGVDIWADTIRIMADTASNSALAQVAGGLSSGIDYSVTANNLVSNNNGFLILSNYTLDGNISGTFINTSSSASLISNVSNVTLTAGSMNLGGNIDSTGAVTVDASGAILASANVDVGGFIQQGGTWTQIVGQNGLTALPKFKVSGDFELQGGTFERFDGGLGTAASPYLVNDIHGLQGIGSPSAALLSDSFALDGNIKGEGTASWNGGAGFVPIGFTSDFTGSFNGQGNTISGLTINLPGTYGVGLFGETSASALVENVGLTNESISGFYNVGGLVASNLGTVQSSYVTGTISGNDYVGGMVGFNGGTVESSSANGLVTGGSLSSYIGGLVGYNSSTIESSYATSAVNVSSGSQYVGGLTGYNLTTVEGSYAIGTVTGGTWTGGLVGDNAGTVESSYATGAVAGSNGGYYAGGLVGANGGTVQTSYALGTVSGSNDVGGLVGENNSNVTSSYATGAVTGSAGNGIGGLVGYNNGGIIQMSYANGAVMADGTSQYEGGLVGQSTGTVELSYATGSVTGFNYVGGLVGQSTGTEELSFATGAVSGSYDVGGLLGENDGMIQTSYALSTVTAASSSTSVGGLVGYNSSTGTIETTYSKVGVTAGSGSNYVGGLVGFNSGSVKTSYWANDVGSNSDLSTDGFENGSIDGYTTGVSSTALTQQATFQPAGTGVPNWDFTTTWTTNGDTTTPLLQALTVSLSGSVPDTGDTVELIGQGAVLYSTTSGGGGAYSFTVPDNVVTSGALIDDETGSFTNTFYVAGAIPTGPITGVSLVPNTFNVVGTGVASNMVLGNAVGSLTGHDIGYAVSGNNLTTSYEMNIGTTYQLDGNITVDNLLNTAAASQFIGNANVTLAADNMALNGSIADSGTVTFSASGLITDLGTVSVGGFLLQNGTWSQIVGQNGLTSLPAFSATSDFELQGSSTFARFAGGDGSTGNPYQIADVYGLQGLGSPSTTFEFGSFNLVRDIDATSTASWNSGAGFVPIGTGFANSNATLNGQGNAINGLTINEPFQSDVGLFVGLSTTALVENLNLTNVQIIGSQYVGGLAGVNYSRLNNISVSGSVGGNGDGSDVGGLVGANYVSITNSSSSASVGSASYYAGGLVGENQGTISYSYSTGQVSGLYIAGGLVGENDGTINNDFSISAVGGNLYLGGLVGLNNSGSISDSYSTGAVSGIEESAYVGGLVGGNQSTITNAYSTGLVSVGSGSTDVGGFVGSSSGSITNGFWDVDSAGVPLGLGSDPTNLTPGVAAATTAQLETQGYFVANATGWDFTSNWSTKGDTHPPQLIGLPTTPPPLVSLGTLSGTTYQADGVTASPGAIVNLVYNGSVLASTTADSSGDYTFNVGKNVVAGGILLTDVNDTSSTFFQTNFGFTAITGINLTGSTLTVRGDTVSNTALGAATGSLGLYGSPLINYSVADADLSTPTGVGVYISDNFAQDGLYSAYTLDGNITASGSLVTDLGTTLTSSLPSVTLTGATMGLNGTITTTGTLTLTSTVGAIDAFNATITAPNATITSAGDVDIQETNGMIALGGNVSSPGGTGYIDIANGTTITANNSDLTASGPLLIDDSSITLNNGNLTGSGSGMIGSSNGMEDGIDVFDTTINAQGGTIMLTGVGGYTFSPDVGPDGGYIGGNGVAISESNIQTSGGGDITIMGSYANNVTTYGSTGNTPGICGVAIETSGENFGTGVTLSVAQGALSITGTVSAGTDGDGTSMQFSGGTTGLYIDAGTTIQATDVGGSVSLTGNTSGSKSYDNATNDYGAQNEGLVINSDTGEGPVTTISVDTGSLTMNGTGGTVDSTYATSFNNTGEAEGLVISTGVQIMGGNGATISITGTGGAAITNDGGLAAAGTSYTGEADGLEIGDNNEDGGIAAITVGDGGSISLTGYGGTMDVSNDVLPGANENPSVGGLQIHHASQVTANGSATITITGTGGTVTAGTTLIGSANGVSIGGGDNEETGDNTVVSSDSGLITINGTGGSTPNLGIGVVISGFNGNTAEIETTTGNIAITGTGGAGYTGTGTITTLPGGEPYVPNYGVGIVDAATLQTGGGGTISITGTGGANSAGAGATEITDIPSLDSAPVSPTITSSGLLTLTSLAGTDITLTNTLIGAPAISLNSANNAAIAGTQIDLTGTLTVNAVGTITDTSAVDVGSFILQSGTWSQIVGENVSSLPAFSTATDFELQGGTFERFAGIDTANGNADEITDIYGLQGLGSPSGALLGATAELVNNIDATTTSEANWNGDAGFAPIGTDSASFSGNFTGAGYTINGLTIDLTGSGSVGLFGATFSSAVVENVALTNETVYGLTNVGGVVGTNGGTLAASYATGTITGTPGGASIGGLVGFNGGTVETSYATSTVMGGSGTGGVGGLVGENDGTVQTSYGNATVTGGYGVGGLVGDNNATVTASYAMGSVTGDGQVGGLVGSSEGMINNAYSTAAVTGRNNSNGVGGLVGSNGSSISNTYSTGLVTAGNGSTDVGGLVGSNTTTISNSFWTTDTAGVTLGVGSDPTNTTPGVTAATTSLLQSQSYILANATTAPTFDFTPVTGVWGSNGVMGTAGGTVLVNNGLPYFQWQYATPIELVANSQSVAYGSTINTSGYSVLPGSATLADYVSAPVSVTSPVTVTSGVGTYTGAISFAGSIQPNVGVTIEQANGDEIITPALLTITANSTSKTYGNTITFAGTEFTSSNLQNGETVGAVTLSSAGAAQFANVTGSPYSITASNATGGTFDPANYSITYVAGSLTVTPAALTVTTTNGTSTYGSVPNVSGNYTDNAIAGDTNPIFSTAPTVSTTATQFSTVAGGPYAITASGAVASNYTITYSNVGQLTVNPAALTVTTTSASTTYGNTVPDVSGNYTDNAIAGDPNPVYSTAPNVTTTATQFSTVAGGPYAITATGAVAPNYTITYNNAGALTVNPAALTVTTTNATTTYGNTVPDVSGNYTDNAIAGDPNPVYSTAPNVTTTATQFSTVAGGPYAITASGAVASNYTITYNNVGQLAVNPAALTVTTTNGTSTYGSVPNVSGNYTDNAIAGDPNPVYSTAPTVTTTATATSNVASGPYPITAAGAVAPNYTITYSNVGQLSINAALLTITANDAVNTYGQTLTFLGTEFTANGLQNGETVGTVTLPTVGAFTTVASSPYLITPSNATGGTFNPSNYTISYQPGNLTILPAAMTVTTTGASTTYGNAVPNLSGNFTYTSVAGDPNTIFTSGPNVTTTATQFSTVAGGPYAITASGAVTPNYTVTYVNSGALTVNPAPLTITTTNTGSTYGSVPDLSGSFTDTSIVGDPNPVYSTAPNVTTTATQFSTVAGGPYAINATGAVAPNYTITYNNVGQLTVNPAPLTITTTNASKTYGSANPDLSGNFTDDSIAGDPNPVYSTSPTISTTATQYSSVSGGPYPITATGAAAPNYTITYNNTGVLAINQATLTVTADDQSKVYGAADPTLTYTVSGLMGTDQPSVVSGVNLSTTIGAAATAGTHAIAATGGTAQNYSITDVNGTLTVTPATLTVTANGDTQTYSATPYSGDTQGVTYSGFQYGDTAASLPGTLSYAGSSQGAVNVGNYSILPTGYTAGNYTYAYIGNQLTINPAQLTVTANDDNQTYSASAYSGGNGVTYTGLQGTDTAASLPGTLVYSGTSQGAVNAGNYTITPGGYTAANYAITYVDGQLTINPAPLTVAANPDGKVYDTNAYSGGNGVMVTGFQGADSVSSLGGALAYSGSAQGAVNAGVYAITPGGYTSQNYAITYVDGPLTVAPAPLTVLGVVAADQPYNVSGTPTPSTTLDLSDASLQGVLGEDSVAIDPNNYTANFINSGPGTQIPISAYIGLTGPSSGNYVVASINPPTGLFADITGSAPPMTTPPPPPIPVPPPVTGTPVVTTTTSAPPVVVPPPGTGTAQGETVDANAVVTTSSDSGSVNSGDTAQINNGGVNNVSNPAAAGVINEALSPAVENALESAMQTFGGGFTDAHTSAANGTKVAENDKSDETILQAGDVVSIGGGKVNKHIPLTEIPRPLQQALGNIVMNGPLSGAGTGH